MEVEGEDKTSQCLLTHRIKIDQIEFFSCCFSFLLLLYLFFSISNFSPSFHCTYVRAVVVNYIVT